MRHVGLLSPESDLRQARQDYDEDFRFRRIADPDSVLYSICSHGGTWGWGKATKEALQ